MRVYGFECVRVRILSTPAFEQTANQPHTNIQSAQNNKNTNQTYIYECIHRSNLQSSNRFSPTLYLFWFKFVLFEFRISDSSDNNSNNATKLN